MGRDEILSLYLSHRGALVSYASAIVGDRGQAEDVVQEAYLRFSTATRGRALEEPVGYLYRIVRNLALDGRRRLAREARVVVARDDAALRDVPEDRASPESEALSRAELETLRTAMAELPERVRTALEMHRFGGRRLREIADVLGVSVTVAHGLVAEGIAYCRRRVYPS